MLVRIAWMWGVIATLLATCKPADGNLNSFRLNDDGSHLALVGVFMNDAPTVIQGEFFPFELYDEKMQALDEEGKFFGYSADKVTNKDPFAGFSGYEAIEEARSFSPTHPNYFGGYYLKIMVADDMVEPIPQKVRLLRGYFPDNFYCPVGLKSIKVVADDNAINPPSNDKLLGIKPAEKRDFRTVIFCKAKETSGKYKGRSFYYTRVGLFDESTHYSNELYQHQDNISKFIENVSQAHESIIVSVVFNRKSNPDDIFTIMASVLGLTYEVKPHTDEMLEKLAVNSVHDLQAVVNSTDAVQRYIHLNNSSRHNSNWDVLLLAQRKWLAIRSILEKLKLQRNKKAEQIRLLLLDALELADFRDMLPLAKSLTKYKTAKEFLYDIDHNPQKTVKDKNVSDAYFSETSADGYNELVFGLSLGNIIKQWVSSEFYYNWVIKTVSIAELCQSICSLQDRERVDRLLEEVREDFADIIPTDRYRLHEIFSHYIEAINKIYPDPRTAPAAYKKSLLFVGNTIDYENSSEAFKRAYQNYSTRYDLMFSEPHGLLLGSELIIKEIGKKKKPTDVRVFGTDAGKTYDWEMHHNIQISTVDEAITSKMEGIHQQFRETINIKNKIDSAKSDYEAGISAGVRFFETHQNFPIAKALLIRPDYTPTVEKIIQKHAKVKTATILEHALLAAAIGTTVAAAAISYKFTSLPFSKMLGFVLYSVSVATDLASASVSFLNKKTMSRRIEGAFFSDTLGSDINEYLRVRKEIGNFKTILYIELGLSAVDFVGFFDTFRDIFVVGKKAIKALDSIEKGVVSSSQELVNNIRNCSTKYCKNFLRGLPFIADQKARGVLDEAAIKELSQLMEQIKSATRLDEFEDVIRMAWFKNKALRPLAEMEMMGSLLNRSFIDAVNPLVGSRRMNNKIKRSLWILSDELTLKKMTAAEKLDLMDDLLMAGRRRERKYFKFWLKDRDHFRQKAAKRLLTMTDKEVIVLHRSRGVIRENASTLLGVNWWQRRKYTRALSYLRGNLQAQNIKIEKQADTWKSVLKAIAPDSEAGRAVVRVGRDADGNDIIKLVDDLNEVELRDALEIRQKHMLDLTNLNDKDFLQLKSRTRFMRVRLKSFLGKVGKRNPSKEFKIIDGNGDEKIIKALGYDIKPEAINNVVEKHPFIKNLSEGERLKVQEEMVKSLKKRLEDEGGLMQKFERFFQQWLSDYNRFLDDVGRPIEIPKPQ